MLAVAADGGGCRLASPEHKDSLTSDNVKRYHTHVRQCPNGRTRNAAAPEPLVGSGGAGASNAAQLPARALAAWREACRATERAIFRDMDRRGRVLADRTDVRQVWLAREPSRRRAPRDGVRRLRCEQSKRSRRLHQDGTTRRLPGLALRIASKNVKLLLQRGACRRVERVLLPQLDRANELTGAHGGRDRPTPSDLALWVARRKKLGDVLLEERDLKAYAAAACPMLPRPSAFSASRMALVTRL